MVAAETADKEDVEAAKLMVRRSSCFIHAFFESRPAGSLGAALSYRAPVPDLTYRGGAGTWRWRST